MTNGDDAYLYENLFETFSLKIYGPNIGKKNYLHSTKNEIFH